MVENLKIVRKKIKNINIRVKPSGEVYVSVPLGTPKTYIEKILAKRALWIQEKLAFYKNHKIPLSQEYKSDETLLYLGEKYTLDVLLDRKNVIMIDKNTIKLFVDDVDDFAKKEKLVDSWYREKATLLFENLIQKYSPIVQKEINRVSVKKMKTRWGSCNHTKGYINLNLHLIKTPLTCIEYVVFHELVHLIHPNHSKKFYNYIEKYMSDFRNRQKELENFRLLYM